MRLDYVSFLECLQVKKHPILRNEQQIIPAVAKVLAWSQWYMRNREVGISYSMATRAVCQILALL